MVIINMPFFPIAIEMRATSGVDTIRTACGPDLNKQVTGPEVKGPSGPARSDPQNGTTWNRFATVRNGAF